MSAYDLTVMALSETHPAARAALEALGPNSAGDPPIGLLGFMYQHDRVGLCRAADMAHRHGGDAEWRTDGLTPDELADYIYESGSWRHAHATRWRERYERAAEVYSAAVFGEA